MKTFLLLATLLWCGTSFAQGWQYAEVYIIAKGKKIEAEVQYADSMVTINDKKNAAQVLNAMDAKGWEVITAQSTYGDSYVKTWLVLMRRKR